MHFKRVFFCNNKIFLIRDNNEIQQKIYFSGFRVFGALKKFQGLENCYINYELIEAVHECISL